MEQSRRPSLLLRVDPSDGTPLFEQVGAQVKQSVAEGRLGAGDRLPSVRDLARQLGINPNTVVRAYQELEAQGWIVRRQGAGCFVAERPEAATPPPALDAEFDRLVTDALHAGVTPAALRAALEAALKRCRHARTGR
jgi:GntR family transcriptional regulator